MAFESPHAVILDDGELTDVRSMLTDLGVPFVDELPKGDGPQRAIPLLVTTSARARGPGAALPANYLHLVVCDATDESTADVPCDFLLQRPIEAAVLRLLTQRAGYEGPERRRMLRVVIDGPVGLWVDDREFDAQLAQLSIGGCGLITHEPPEPGGRAILEFSRELTGPRGLRVNGRVLSVRDVKGSEPPRHDVSIAFDAIELRDRVTLRALMAGQPIDFRPRPSLQIDPGSEASAARARHRRRAVVPVDGDRRALPRRLYNRQVLGGGEGIARVLIGRDISPRGMRVEREALFDLGEEIKLAIYGGVGVSPVMLKAIVARDDAEAGWYLRFAELTPAVERDLEQLIASLAPLDVPDGAGHIMTEVLGSA